MSTPPPLSRGDQVVFSDLTTSRIGIGVSLLRAEATHDEIGVRDAVASVFAPHEVFASLLSLLLTQARVAGASLEVSDGQPIGPANYLSLLGAADTNPARALLLHQVSMALRQDPETTRLCLAPVSVATLEGVCVTVACDLAVRDRITLAEHVEAITTALRNAGVST